MTETQKTCKIVNRAFKPDGKKEYAKEENAYEVLCVFCEHGRELFFLLFDLCMITAFWRFSFYSALLDAIRRIRYNFDDIQEYLYIYTSLIHSL